MLVVLRFRVAEGGAEEFSAAAQEALRALAVRPGYRRGELGQAYDDATLWCLATEWESVGSYRRALGATEVKMVATPLLAQALDEPSAYEPLVRADPGGTVVVSVSDRGPLRSRP
ncbi:MAG: antibiotic biosynthesis monooxygenase family protein [Micromonosporaceae bacterium]